jgi:purine-binding chemotaxis protein CheW
MIILNIARRVVGMVVDGVSDVMQLTAEQIRPAPEFGSAINTRYITGLGTLDNRMLILVDIEKLMSGADMALMDAHAQSLQ